MGKRVLVVDDDLLTLSAVQRILIRAGHEAGVLHGGFGFAIALREFEPDVVLLDVNMPGLNGIGALRSARELQQLSDHKPRVVLHSGQGEHDLREMCTALSADGYLCKPATTEALLRALESPIADGG